MRNAERFIAQGKILSAIDEYKQVVRYDPRDFGTLNILGDLYVKQADQAEAVRCYTQVAEYYSKQGFSQKAIAIYNKIQRLKPNSPEISEKLADLYKSKGSVSEARSHYVTLAEHYLKNGYKTEAFSIWKQIGILDPNNTEVLVTLAEAQLEENQLDEAADSYCEAAERFRRSGDHLSSVDCLTKALGINASNMNVLNAFVRELHEIGRSDEAVVRLEDILKINPHNRDVARILIDCHIQSGHPDEAEAHLIKLVEYEPANYATFLDLVKMYVGRDDATSAARCLTMCSEHMLMGGQSEELQGYINSIIALDPNELGAIRMLARFYSWKRDKDGLRDTLVGMASVANAAGSIDDERYALSQLTILVPHHMQYSERLDEINREHGFVENPFDDKIIQEQFSDGESHDFFDTNFEVADVQEIPSEIPIETNGHSNGHAPIETVEEFKAEIENFGIEDAAVVEEAILAPKYETELDKELESVRFYIENGYHELAARTLEELRQRFGAQPEFDQFDVSLQGAVADNAEGVKPLDIAEIRNEFGIEDEEIEVVADDGDYETHYQMAIAYQEMGLIEEAIKEYQEAIGLVRPNDGTRRFFQCANLLGHCFMQNSMANLALKWYDRALETKDLNDDEKQGIWYELAQAYEAEGDMENAGRYFEQVYAENVNYRDVGECLKRISVQAA
jgi:tetratricopeptide (TPR) repeat protein